MKLACLTMFHNEGSILGPFLDQLQAFFDHACLVDHASTDGGARQVAERGDGRLEVLRLQSAGYPQSEVMTGLARRIMAREAPDFLFLLDCDEFLPFAGRAALEAFLAPHLGGAGLALPWRNLAPRDLYGNLFGGGFLAAEEPSPHHKVILGSGVGAIRGWVIAQGNHALRDAAGQDVALARPAGAGLLHIPVQSRSQFRFKVAAGARRIAGDRALLRAGLGTHWITLDAAARDGRLGDEDLRGLALAYPVVPQSPPPAAPLDFAFPWVASPFREDAAAHASRLEALLVQLDRPVAPAEPGFTVMDAAGEVILAQQAPPVPQSPPPTGAPLPLNRFAEDFSALVEPLFCLPTKMPGGTAWAGHIPFLFALFRTLRPRTYVELGVHKGASLIAGATAARTYGTGTRLYGVDTWEGDVHAGHYGDEILDELRAYVEPNFPDVTLVRSLFSEALPRFAPGTVDLLHIDGLHTYEAVREDFVTWFDRMSPEGVVLFHDTCVHDRGFGVHLLWDELKRSFPTMEFHHAFGLGVLFLDPSAPRFAPFRRLMEDEAAMRAYRMLAASLGNIVEERMAAFGPEADEAAGLRNELHQVNDALRQRIEGFEALQHRVHWLETELDAARHGSRDEVAALREEVAALRDALRAEREHVEAIRRSTSWRLTGPLRVIRRRIGG